jgi:hypothetical protein
MLCTCHNSGSPWRMRSQVPKEWICRVQKGTDAFKSLTDSGFAGEQAQTICRAIDEGAQVAVRQSMQEVIAEIRGLDAKMDSRMQGLEAAMQRDKQELKAAMQLDKQELKAAMQLDKQELKAAMQLDKQELKSDMKELKAAMQRDKQELKADMQLDKKDVQNRMIVLTAVILLAMASMGSPAPGSLIGTLISRLGLR